MKKLLTAVILCFFTAVYISAHAGMIIQKFGGAAPTTYDCTTDSSAMGCYYMNGNTGDEYDRSGQGNDLDDLGSNPTRVSTTPSGYSGYSRDFNESGGDHLNCTEASCPDLNINGSSAKITLAAWIRSDSIANAEDDVIIAKHMWGTNHEQYLLRIYGTATNEFKFQFYLSGDGDTATGIGSTTTNYVTGTWYHIAVTSDNSNMRMYINGSEDTGASTAYSSGIFDSDQDFQVGCSNSGSGSQYFDGLIDEVLVANEALNSTQISYIDTNGIDGDNGGND